MTRASPPGPTGLPGIGNTLQFLRDPITFYETCAEYGDVVHARVARDDVYVVSHPELVERVLVTDEAAYRTPDGFDDRIDGVLASGLLLAEDDRWGGLRTATSALSFDPVEWYADVTVRHAETMAALWDDGETVAVDEAMRELALDVFIDALFGADADHQQRRSELGVDCGGRGEGDSERIREAVHAFEGKFETPARAAFVPDWVPTRTNRRYRRALSEFDAVIGDLIDRRRAAGFENCHDVLSLLLQADDADGDLTESTIRDQLVTFLVAGYETTAAALTFTAYALATHPGVADRLQAEVDAVLGTASATAADLSNLGYTERVVKESLRRYPPLFATFRQPIRETELAGYDLPVQSTVVMPQYVVHNDPRWFTAPETFRPERWATWDGPEFAYFPFGGGSANCIERRFAMQELQLVVATMAQQVSFERANDAPLDLSFGTTLQPAGGLDLVVTERVATPRR
ncbi:cytochrome P450 [Halomarina rubra]|uniref:Cytochrome P450 n=1 Tax=Halomarina rubra TaxID=2071873 RepID=A0ABD6AV45_9EURY|nr:cytochrome P450 [Halomarina rubra]